jgi:magnesium transporter
MSDPQLDPAFSDPACPADTGIPVEENCAHSPGAESDSHDAENRLKRDFVRRVREALDASDVDAVYALVEPLHPADIADLFEALDPDDRPALADAISDLMGAEVFAR